MSAAFIFITCAALVALLGFNAAMIFRAIRQVGAELGAGRAVAGASAALIAVVCFGLVYIAVP